MEIVHIIGQIIFGLFFIMNGLSHLKHQKSMASYARSKKLPYPHFSVIFSGTWILIAGLMIIFDYYENIAYWMIAIFLLVTSFVMHRFWNVSAEHRMNERIAFTKNLALMGSVLMLATL